ncbi:hypothetical protein KY363_06525 [Candidatus Woesearchaeota archaeon]|nr:hypothetical protein [Candidatus Woesearchaeota archaeon]
MKKTKTPKETKKLHKKPWVIILAVVVVLLIVFFAYVYSHPKETEVRASDESAQLHAILAVYGIDDAVVGSSDTIVFIRYVLPEGMSMDDAVRYIAIAGANTYAATDEVVIQTYSDGKMVGEKNFKAAEFR